MFLRSKKRQYPGERSNDDDVKDVEIGTYPREKTSYKWIKAPSRPDEPLPDGIVCAGKMETDQLAYVGRANIGDQTAAGFFLKETREIHIPYGCTEHQLQEFDILVVEDQDMLLWEQCADGKPPTNTACVPLDVDGPFRESMRIGRTCTPLTEGVTYQRRRLELSRHAHTGNDIHRAGKIHRNHGCLYIPYSGLEYIFREHEMLMLKTNPGSLQRICRWTILTHLRPRNSRLDKAIEKLPIAKPLKMLLISDKQ